MKEGVNISDNLIKVELGCGKTKHEGYLGIDRFDLPGVDIVADLNNGIPLDENKVDLILACHFLEHIDNLYSIMEEIFRVCKHKAIVLILAPYHMQTTNYANFYHKQAFNEDTFRFFTNDQFTYIDDKEYYNPHALSWGLSQSDNSSSSINFQILDMKFYYFPDYENLSEEEKRHSRKSFLNVCDQIYYALAINKSDKCLLEDEINELKMLAENERKSIPILISLDNRILNKQMGNSIISDIKKWDEKLFNENKELINENSELINEYRELFNSLNKKLDNISNELIRITNEKNSLEVIILDIIKSSERKGLFGNKFKFYRNSTLYKDINMNYPYFTDGIIFLNKSFNKDSVLLPSKTILYEHYNEYRLEGSGNKIYFFIFSNIGSRLFVEVVYDHQIIKQEEILVLKEGQYTITLNECIDGEVFVRFRVLNNYSIVKVLEISNKWFSIFSKNTIAGFIE